MRFFTLLLAFIVSFFRHQHHFFSWAWRISKGSRETGCRACELMLRDPARFEAPVVFCDIPRTRARYLKRVGVPVSCAKDGLCRPHLVLPTAAQEELSPEPKRWQTGHVEWKPSSPVTT
ncbi:MAG: hypothetical protein WA082_01260 [Candidatus Moraniibacteriota bacterium]